MVACRPEVNKARTTPDPRRKPDWLAGNPGKFSGAVTGAVDLGRYWTGGPDRRGAGRFPGRLGGPDGPGSPSPPPAGLSGGPTPTANPESSTQSRWITREICRSIGMLGWGSPITFSSKTLMYSR